MRRFFCRKNRCKGVTAAVCIKRQWATTLSLYARYPECADGCDQGLEIAEFHSDLTPDRPRPGTPRSRTCTVCGDKFPPMTKDQQTCSRGCGGDAGLRTREAKRQAQLAREYEDSSHISLPLDERPPGGRALLTPPSNNEHEVSPAPTPSEVPA